VSQRTTGKKKRNAHVSRATAAPTQASTKRNGKEGRAEAQRVEGSRTKKERVRESCLKRREEPGEDGRGKESEKKGSFSIRRKNHRVRRVCNREEGVIAIRSWLVSSWEISIPGRLQRELTSPLPTNSKGQEGCEMGRGGSRKRRS